MSVNEDLFDDELGAPPSPPEKLTTESVTAYNKAMGNHLGKARSLLRSLGEDKAAQARAIADLKVELQAIQQQAALPRERGVDESASERDLVTRYVDSSGRLHLKGAERTLEFGGRKVRVEQRGLLDDPSACSDWHLELQKLCATRSMVRMFAKEDRSTPKTDAAILRHMSRAPNSIRGALEKAITDSAAAGAEWIPEYTVPTIYEDQFKTPNRLAGLFEVVNMPTNSMKQPRIGAGARPYKKSSISSDDPASFTASTPVSSDDTITVTNMAVRVVYDEMDGEDAVVMMEPMLRRIVAEAINDGYEDCMVNGDTATTHQDTIASWNIRSRWGATGLGGSADHRRLFLGLRALAADRTATTNMGSLQTVSALMSSLVGGLGERAASRVAILVSPEVFYQKLLADSNVLTLEKLGPNATLLSGQLGSVFNIPLVPTRWLSADLESSGLYTDGSGGLSGVLAVDRGAFFHYQRRGLQVEMERQIINGSNHVVATLRRLFKTPSSSSETVVHYGYNWLS